MPDAPDRGSGPWRDGQPDPPQRRWQHVTNASWPKDAARINDRPADEQFMAEVRVVFERDGEVWLTGRVIRWTSTHVCFSVNDPRLQTRFVWVRSRDARRI